MPAELALHDTLLANPRRAVPRRQRSQAIATPMRGRITASGCASGRGSLPPSSLEAAYVGLFQGDGVDVPPLFVHQLTQVLLRHILGEDADADGGARGRDAVSHRRRSPSTEDGAVMAADETTVELFASTAGFGSLGELLAQNTDTRALGRSRRARRRQRRPYWDRDERHDFSVSLNRGQPALDALTRVLEKWMRHFLGVEVTIRQERAIDDEHWVWHVGLDAEASGLLNDLYNRVDIDDAAPAPAAVPVPAANSRTRRTCVPAIAGRPVYLAMAMDAEQRLKLKPQNLLLNLPLARAQ